MKKTWAFHKLTTLEVMLEQDIVEVRRIEGAWEVDSGFELELAGEFKDGKRIVPPRTLRILPIIEDGKPRLYFELIEGEES